MKLLWRAADGGKNSGVTGYFLIEWKSVFSVVLLHFNKGSREAYHSHAFNAWTLWLWGLVVELHREGGMKVFMMGDLKRTYRDTFHKVECLETAWALSIRGPWSSTWQEDRNGKLVTLTHGRREVRL